MEKEKNRYLIILLLFLLCVNISAGQNVRRAWEYFENERYNLAAIEFSKVIKASEERYGKDLTLAQLYFFTGFSFYKEEKTDSAIIYYLKSIQTYEAIKNDTIDAWYGVCLNNLGSIRKAQGQFEIAEHLFSEALSITEITEGTKSENYCVRLNNLAELYRKMGYTTKAIPLYDKAIELIETNFGKENKWHGTLVDNLAITYEQNGLYEKALRLHLEALKSTEISLGKNHLDYSIRLNNTATCYRYLGQYSNAFNFYEEALEVARRTLKKDDPSIGNKLFNLASMYMVFKQYEKALTYSYEYLFDILLINSDLNKNEIPESLNQIATLHIYLEQFEKADSALTMALNIIDDYNLKIDGTYCSILNTYGYLQRNLKKHNEALFYYENALQCLILIDSTNIHGSVSITNNISEIYGYLGNYEKALEYQLSSFNKLKAHSDIFSEEYETCLTNLALNNILGSNYEKALDLVIEAINISKKRIEESFTFLSTEERGNYLEESNSASLFLPSLANKLINSFPTISTFAYNNELFTNAILLNTSRNIQQSILNSKDSSLISTYEDFKNLRRQINYLQQQPVEKQLGLPELEEKANQLDKQLTKASQAYQQNKENLNIQWQDVQNNLKENEAAVQFISFPYYNKRWTDSTMYCALIVKPEMEYPAMIPLFEEKQLQALLEGQANPNTLYASRGTKVSYANTPAKSNGDELYHLIWQPLQSELNEVQTVYFAPSGLLHKVSFSALPVDSTKLLCDQFSLYRLSSTRNVAVQEIYEEEPGTKKIALFGGIDYDLSNQSWSDNELTLTYTESILSRGFSPDSSQRSITFNYLEGTKKEVENIASIVKSNNEFELKYYTADKATEEAFKKLSNQNLNLIHIATHGFFFPPVHQENMRRHELQTLGEQRFRYVPNPLLRSGLLMAGANRTWKGDYPKDSLEDGVLTAQEISEMNLLNTKLVVLSACETGLGDINNSEGVFGLQRAFKLAGVKTLIMSLWKVPDKQTSMLMQAFYTNWLGGMSKHEAFKKAQLSVRKTHSEPYYWAGFVMVD